MALVGSGCEKAKHHLNPSPKRPKTLRNRKQKTGETLPTEPSKDKDKNVALVGSGCEKAKHHLNPSPKRPKTLRNRKQKTGETLPTEPSKDKDKNGSRRQCTTNLQAAGKLAKRCLRNPLKTKAKMALVGSGCEKAKHHLNPSPKRPKTLRNRKQKTGETLPTEPSKDKGKNGFVGSGCENAKHHLNPSPKRLKSYETGSGKLAKRCVRNPLKTSLDQRQK